MSYPEIRNCGPYDEPKCSTSEPGERLFSCDEIRSIGFDIGRRVLELFGHQDIPNMVFRLRSTAREVNAVINGDELPSIELLLALRSQTGVSIDWVLTGVGPKFGMANTGAAPLLPQRPEMTVLPFPKGMIEPLAA